MSIRKEIKQYSNRRQINLNKGELESETEVLILDKNDELQHEKILENVATQNEMILKYQSKVSELQKEIRIKDDSINELTASYIDVANKYNNLIDAITHTSWIDGILNRFKKVLENHSQIKQTDTIKAIETSVTDGVGTAESDSVTDNVASDDKDNQ